MTRAALVQGWNRAKSRRGKPVLASLQPSGSLYAGDASAGNIGVGAEIYLGDQGWMDISQYIYYRDGSTKVSISRGRPDESGSSMPPPQSCSFQLNNRDARFSPRNPVGPLYGLIGRNTLVRFWRMQNGVRRYRYYGEIPEWPSNADITNTDVYTSIAAYGQLRRLTQGNKPLGSAMRRNMLDINRANGVSARIFDYWPCEDGIHSTVASSALAGRNPLFVSGSGVAMASDSSYVASDPLPVFSTGGFFSGNIPTYTSTGTVSLRFFLSAPSGGVASTQHMVSLFGTGTAHKFSLMLDSSGDLWLFAYNAAGTELTGNGPVAFAVNGKKNIVGLDLVQSGSNINWNIYTFSVDNILTINWFDGGIVPGEVFTGTLNSNTVGVVQNIMFGEDKGMASCTIGQISLANSTGAYTSTLPGMTADSGEIPQNRIARLCLEKMVQFSGSSSQYDAPYSVTMGAQPSDTFGNLISQAAATDGGMLYEGTDRPGLLMRTLASLYNQDATLTLDMNQGQLSSQLVPRDDDYYTKNDVIVQRVNGASSRQVQTSGTLNNSDPPTGVGEYDVSYDVSLFDDVQPADQAGWRLHLGTVDEIRYPSISVNLRHQSFQNSIDLTNAALSVDIGDRIAIANPPSWLPPDTLSLIVLGYQETMGAFEHGITFNCAPASPYEVFVVEDWVTGRADTNGSTLAAAAGSSDTVLSFVPTDSKTAQWTVSPGDFPFDVGIAGERITVVSPVESYANDPFLSSGTAHYSGTKASIAMDAYRPFPTNQDGILRPFAKQTILATPDGSGAAAVDSDKYTFVDTPGDINYTGWVWVYAETGRSYSARIIWYDSSNVQQGAQVGGAVALSGNWTLLKVSQNRPATAVKVTIGVVDSTGSPANTYFHCWGFNVAHTSSLAVPAVGAAQGFFVTRSVNGVQKSHLPGEDVRLWTPPIIGL